LKNFTFFGVKNAPKKVNFHSEITKSARKT
jgi:hypothetical protein